MVTKQTRAPVAVRAAVQPINGARLESLECSSCSALCLLLAGGHRLSRRSELADAKWAPTVWLLDVGLRGTKSRFLLGCSACGLSGLVCCPDLKRWSKDSSVEELGGQKN